MTSAGTGDLSQRIQRLETQNAALLAEVRRLGADRSQESVTDRMGRRGFFSRIGRWAAGGLGALLGITTLTPSPVNATTGTMQFGTENDAGSDTTTLKGSSVVFHVQNTDVAHASSAFLGFGGSALYAQSENSDGNETIYAEANGDAPVMRAVQLGSSSEPAVDVLHSGDSPGIRSLGDTGLEGIGNVGVRGHGSPGVVGTSIGPTDPGVKGEHPDVGPGVVGDSVLGPGIVGSGDPGVRGAGGRRGGVFSGEDAQVRLVPSTSSTHPGFGTRGDLFADRRGRLWFCKGGGSWKQLA